MKFKPEVGKGKGCMWLRGELAENGNYKILVITLQILEQKSSLWVNILVTFMQCESAIELYSR